MSHRLRLVLVSPRIAANVGNIARTALALSSELHLVRPFGFHLDLKKLDRTSVGYWERLQPTIYKDGFEFWERIPLAASTEIHWATKNAEDLYTNVKYGSDVVLIFGSEEDGVPQAFFEGQARAENVKNIGALRPIHPCRIPMGDIRCLNLATSVGILGYEVVRQWGIHR